jgi:hypothetical protein
MSGPLEHDSEVSGRELVWKSASVATSDAFRSPPPIEAA